MNEITIKYFVDENGNCLIEIYEDNELIKTYNYEYCSIECAERYEEMKNTLITETFIFR